LVVPTWQPLHPLNIDVHLHHGSGTRNAKVDYQTFANNGKRLSWQPLYMNLND